MLIFTVMASVVLSLGIAGLLFFTASKNRSIRVKLVGMLILLGLTLNTSCIHRVEVGEGRPYYYENHVRIWHDGHDDNWHHDHGDKWEEEHR